MSKNAVPDVYSRVIRDVCEQSRVDFEEGGVDLNALEMLKQGWQKRLSDLRIAQFPWDPKADAQVKVDAALPSNVKSTPTLPSNGNTNSPSSSTPTPGIAVKQEAQSYPPQQPIASAYPPAPQFPQGRPVTAQERAAMHLHQRFGNQAGTQVAQLQNAGQPRPSGTQGVQQSNTFVKQEDGGSQSFRPELPQQTPIKTDQTDGASDVRGQYESELVARRTMILQNREHGNHLMRAHFLASQQELEAGGLMIPLDDHSHTSPALRRKIQQLRAPPLSLSSSSSSELPLQRAQGDAAGDDEEEDEDAINSDLDDPDELDNNDNDEENVPEVMLCTYDKVQRVKNKWKCTLKDGILRVEGAEYVFHKGQGEFEW